MGGDWGRNGQAESSSFQELLFFFFFCCFFFFLFHAVADPKHKIIIGDMRDGHTRQVSGGRKILRL